MDTIKFGIVGTGQNVGIAGSHLEGIANSELGELVAIYDINRSFAESFSERNKLENVQICDSYDSLLEMVDAVLVCVPNKWHIEVAIKALHHHKHVLIEKPIAVDAASVDELLVVAEEKKDLVSMVSFNYREFQIYQYIKELLQSGRLGKIYTYRQQLGGNRIANKDVKLEWRMDVERSGPGAVSDFGCHMLDIAHFLLSDIEGSMKDFQLLTSTVIRERNDPMTNEKRPVTNDDAGMFIARTEGGALLSFSASRVGVVNHSIEIVGEGGMVSADFSKPREVNVWLKDKDGGYVPEEQNVIKLEGNDGHNGIIQNFIDCIHGRAVNERTI